MNEAPSGAGIAIVQEPGDRTSAIAFQHFVDLFLLLCQVHVNRAGGQELFDPCHVFVRNSPEAMGGNTQPAIRRQASHGVLYLINKPREPVEIVAKPDLARSQGTSVASAILVENRQSVSPAPLVVAAAATRSDISASFP